MTIGAGCHPNKVKVSGPGVAKSGLKAFEPTYFTVDCAEAGQGEQRRHQQPEGSFFQPAHFLSVFDPKGCLETNLGSICRCREEDAGECGRGGGDQSPSAMVKEHLGR